MTVGASLLLGMAELLSELEEGMLLVVVVWLLSSLVVDVSEDVVDELVGEEMAVNQVPVRELTSPGAQEGTSKKAVTIGKRYFLGVVIEGFSTVTNYSILCFGFYQQSTKRVIRFF